MRFSYATVGPDGSLLYVGDLHRAMEVGRVEVGPTLVDHVPDETRRNPAVVDEEALDPRAAQSALQRSLLPTLSGSDVLSMSIEEAYDRVIRAFRVMNWWQKPTEGTLWDLQAREDRDARRWQEIQRDKKTVEQRLFYGHETPKYGEKTPARVQGFARSMLTDNAKLNKLKRKSRMIAAQMRPEQRAVYRTLPPKLVVKGLGLVPHGMVDELITDPEFGHEFAHMRALKHRGAPKVTWCMKSNPMCRDGCLTFAGHNWNVIYNAKVKAAKAAALLTEPLAFMRLVWENLEALAVPRGRKRLPFIRLNVLSDIPWELVCPDLFAAFRGRIQFYDYTKVQGRRTPPNYDLTFSYSGTNTRATHAELAAGRRAAIVFLGFKETGRGSRSERKWHKVGSKAHAPLPTAFGFDGYPTYEVWDGDAYDVRPADPGRVWVGLRWKDPTGQAPDKKAVLTKALRERVGFEFDPKTREWAKRAVSGDFGFVVPVYEADGAVSFEAPSGRRNPNGLMRAKVLVSPATPRQGGWRNDPEISQGQMMADLIRAGATA